MRRLDLPAPDLDPVVAVVQDLEAEQLGAAVGLDQEGETRMRQAGVAPVLQLYFRAREAKNAVEDAAVDPQAHVQVAGGSLGEEPARDPRLAARKHPVGRCFHLKDIGIVLVHLCER